MATYMNPIPQSASAFANTYVIPNLLKREALAKWFDDMYKKYTTLGTDDIRKDLEELVATLQLSLAKTTSLYQIQSARNINNGKNVDVIAGDYYSKILSVSHEQWDKFGIQMQLIFALFNEDDYAEVVSLPEQQPTDNGGIVLVLHCVNPTIQKLLNQMREHTNNMEDIIQNLPTTLNT